jgi:hypothetical protein
MLHPLPSILTLDAGATQRIAKRASTRGCFKDVTAGDSVQFSTQNSKRTDHQNAAKEGGLGNSVGRNAPRTPDQRTLPKHWSTTTASHNQIGNYTEDSVTAQDLSLLMHPSHETTAFPPDQDRSRPPQVLGSNLNEGWCLLTDAYRILNVPTDKAKRL